MAQSPLALRPRDAAKALGISARTLWRLTAPRGPIPCKRVGNGVGKGSPVLYSVADLQAWLCRAAIDNLTGDAAKRGLDLRRGSEMEGRANG